MVKIVFGIDGCRGGWIAAGIAVDPGRAEVGRLPQFALFPTFGDCLAAANGAILVVDIPVGLPQSAVPGGRPCDRAARRLLGRPRASSVFSPPARPALDACGNYVAACRRNGRGMSKQAFYLMPKIGEVDAVLSPVDQTRVYEGHPELAFLRLAGASLPEPKRSAAGRARRLALLDRCFGHGINPEAVCAELGRDQVAADDVIDAAVLTLTALQLVRHTARRLGGGERDARGLEMAIWY